MPIANASAILQSLPLAVTLAAALFLGERVGWLRYLAIGIGFVGVLIIVRPGSDGFNAYALAAIAAVGFIALRDLSTRQLAPRPAGDRHRLRDLGRADRGGGPCRRPRGVAAADARPRRAAGGGRGLPDHRLRPGVTAMRLGEIGFVQPFRYTLLIWAMLYGLALFGEAPDPWMLPGSAIVVATGFFTLHRERRLAAG